MQKTASVVSVWQLWSSLGLCVFGQSEQLGSGICCDHFSLHGLLSHGCSLLGGCLLLALLALLIWDVVIVICITNVEICDTNDWLIWYGLSPIEWYKILFCISSMAMTKIMKQIDLIRNIHFIILILCHTKYTPLSYKWPVANTYAYIDYWYIAMLGVNSSFFFTIITPITLYLSHFIFLVWCVEFLYTLWYIDQFRMLAFWWFWYLHTSLLHDK